MANPDFPEPAFEPEPMVLPDGHRLFVQAYEDGSVQVSLDGSPYVFAEARLSDDEPRAIVNLSPGKQGSAAHRSWLADKRKGNS